MRLPIKIMLFAAFSLSMMTRTALADAIDGNWCHVEGGNLEIQGPKIMTPGGTRMTGEYSRHTFRYVAPNGERAAGSTINMALVDDETLHLLIEGGDGEIEIWRRCAVHTS